MREVAGLVPEQLESETVVPSERRQTTERVWVAVAEQVLDDGPQPLVVLFGDQV